MTCLLAAASPRHRQYFYWSGLFFNVITVRAVKLLELLSKEAQVWQTFVKGSLPFSTFNSIHCGSGKGLLDAHCKESLSLSFSSDSKELSCDPSLECLDVYKSENSLSVSHFLLLHGQWKIYC